MDSPVVNRIFQQLFTAPARGCLQSAGRKPPPRSHLLSTQRRGYARGLRSKEDDGSGRSTWQQRLDYFPKDVTKQLKEFPRVTARELRHRAQRPKRVKMYTRDFIEGSSIYDMPLPLAHILQTVCTIRTMATSLNKLPSSHLESHSTSLPLPTKLSSTS